VVKFIIHKYFSTNSMVLRRTQELHATDILIVIHKFFIHQKGSEEMFLDEQERVIGFSSITLLMELFIN
jgi:hypothetical protein